MSHDRKPDPSHEIRIVRRFAASPRAVFERWLTREGMLAWWAPDEMEVSACEVDARPGGAFRVAYGPPGGEQTVEEGTFRTLERPSRIVFGLKQTHAGHAYGETIVDVSFGAAGHDTEMRFHQTGFESKERRDGNHEGWLCCFAKLDQALGEADIRALFARWSDASARRDLDGSMEPIAEDVVSFEHELPLQVQGIEALRKQCKAGFDASKGDIRWSVPDLRVVIRGNVASTWGTNQMVSTEGGKTTTSWSRGTRIFQRRDGAWKMIHQHVSFPFDPGSGKTIFDAPP